MDALNLTCSMNKLQYLSIDRASVLLSKAKILIDSKYQVAGIKQHHLFEITTIIVIIPPPLYLALINLILVFV